jgi:large subunit ribosomal protein L17
MRHRKSGKKLGRPTAHRYAMLRNMAISLVEHGRIETTVTRAKALKIFLEPIITLGKKGDLSARRLALKKLPNKKTVHKIFEEVAPKFADRPGGYTRVIKSSVRRGDNAQLAIIEFVENIKTEETKTAEAE